MSGRLENRGGADTGTVTPNQRAILLRLFAGEAVEEIAAATGRKPSTIANTALRVRDQLGARNTYDLFRRCLNLGVFTLAEINAHADAHPAPARRAAGGPRR